MNIIELATENCPYHSEEMRGAYYDGFVRSAALVRAETKEECAKKVEQFRTKTDAGIDNIAEAIRSL